MCKPPSLPILQQGAVSDRRLLVIYIDYYYYATAGGKKIWVRVDLCR